MVDRYSLVFTPEEKVEDVFIAYSFEHLYCFLVYYALRKSHPSKFRK